MRALKKDRHKIRTSGKISKSKKTIAIDFDGTIVKNKYPFIENPDTNLLDFIRNNRDKYNFILWTCREGKQLKYATEWLEEQGIVFDLINDNLPWKTEEFGYSRKIWADYYIDDKNADWRDL